MQQNISKNIAVGFKASNLATEFGAVPILDDVAGVAKVLGRRVEGDNVRDVGEDGVLQLSQGRVVPVHVGQVPRLRGVILKKKIPRCMNIMTS